jgi:hypothetical protein
MNEHHANHKLSKTQQLQMRATKSLLGNKIFASENTAIGRKLADMDRHFAREALIQAVKDKNARGIMAALGDYTLQDIDMEPISGDALVAVLEDLDIDEKEQIAILKELLDKKHAKPNFTGETGVSPLHAAALKGCSEAIYSLLRFGAMVNVKDENGITPLFAAAWNGDAEVMKLLLTAGADVKVIDNSGSTALHVAAIRSNIDAIKQLIAAGANVNLVACVITFDDTPLHLAAHGGDVESIRLLIAAGANLHAMDSNNNTPLKLATTKGHIEAANFIKHAMKTNS